MSIFESLTRREFFQAAALGAVGGAVAYGLGTHIPEGQPRAKSSEYAISPGWIEANIRAPFLHHENGHFDYLREGIFNNPLVFELTKEFFTYLLTKKEQETRVSLGEMMSFVIGRAHERLSSDGNKIDPTLKDNVAIEAVHAGLFALAGGLATVGFREADLARLDVGIAPYPDMNSFWWYTTGLGTVVLPQFFGIDRRDDDRWLTDHSRPPIFGGVDRAAHVAHHMFLTFSYLYSKHFNLPSHKRIPLGIQLVLEAQRKARRIETDEGEAHALSGLAGRAFELLGIPKSIGEWWKDRNERIIEGWFDEMRDSDLKANDLGAQIGSELWERVKNEDPIEPVITELRDGKFKDLQEAPVLASRLPRFSHGLSR